MAIQFILGRSGSGKSKYIESEIIEKQLENQHHIIYLVPEQMTFQTEYSLVKSTPTSGFMKLQVISFTRLAFRILQETGGITRYHVDHLGINMLLRKIIEQNKEHLKVFKQSSSQQGFYEQLEQMITECKRYAISPEDWQLQLNDLKGELQQQDKQGKDSNLLYDKLHDFQLIYSLFQEEMLHKYIMSEDYLTLLAKQIKESSFVQDAFIYVDGFYQFTPQEVHILTELAKHSIQVHIALTIDRPYDEKLPDKMNTFYTTAQTYKELQEVIRDQEIIEHKPILLEEKSSHSRFLDNPSLAHLEQQIDSRPVVPYDETPNVQIVQASTRRAEVEAVAREMIYLAQKQEYRWRDMAILVRDISLYHDVIETVMEDYEVPVFIDQKRSMLHHPLIECIRSALDILQHNWRYEAIFRCVKTELLLHWGSMEELNVLRDEIDRLENLALEYGISGSKWTDDENWHFIRNRNIEEEEQDAVLKEQEHQRLEQLRQEIIQPIQQLQSRLRRSTNVREMCTAIYFFLEEIEAPRKITYWRDVDEKNGQLQRAREHEQSWKAVLHLLDQLVELLGDQNVSLEMLIKMIDEGCQSMQFALVPPAIDQIVVGSLDRSRLSQIKCAFIIGANEGVLPARARDDGILSEEDRVLLQARGIRLAPGVDDQLSLEQFYTYIGLTTSSDQLWISYALADEEGKSLLASSIIPRLKQLFPKLEERIVSNDPMDVEQEKQLQYIMRPQKSLSYFVAMLRHWERGEQISSVWWDVYHWLIDQQKWREPTRLLSSSLFYKNQVDNLPRELSFLLYGESLRLSVSRMEKYNSCAYSHFLAYGLRLQERKLFKLEAPDIGQLFHAAFKLIDEEIKRRGLEWERLSKEDTILLANEVVSRIAPRLGHHILFSSGRHHYIQKKLSQVVQRSTWALAEHAKASQFKPIGLEVDFGPQGPLQPLRFSLHNGAKMEIIGRIDRVDLAKNVDELLLRVIDYKSSSTALNLNEVYYGLSLQMLTYLDVLLSSSKSWLGMDATPAGVLYFHVHNPMVKKNQPVSFDLVEEELFKQYKMKGLVLGDPDVVRMMDESIDKYSKIIPVGMFKDKLYKNSQIASKEEFTHLRKYVRKQMQQIGTNISEGRIEINPYQLQKKKPCTFCAYKSICQFDQGLSENQFSLLRAKGKEVILEEIRNM